MDRRDVQGFTLVELISVIVLIALVMMLIVPGLSSLMNANRKKEYETYMDMMVEYTKTYPKYKEKEYICLSDLDIKEIKNNTDCNGYVTINGNTLKAFLSCKRNNEEMYITPGINDTILIQCGG